MERFDKEGRLIIPISKRVKDETKEKTVRYAITERMDDVPFFTYRLSGLV